MKIRWSNHAVENLTEREVSQSEADKAIADPEFIVADPPDRQIYMRRYFDVALQKQMLLRIVVEEGEAELVVITVYKTSQLRRYLPR